MNSASIVRAHRSGQEADAAMSLRNLPRAVLAAASSRVRWIAIVCAITTLAATALECLFQPELAKSAWMPLTGNAVMALSLSIFLVAARQFGWVSAPTIVRLGFAFEIAVGFGIAFVEYSASWDLEQPVRGISWIALWLSLCTLLIPNRPVKVLLAALTTAAMEPIGYLAAHYVSGLPPFPANRLFISAAPGFVVAIGAVALNRKLYQLELEIDRVKEMGSYKLDTLLGKGGMGEVWRARHQMLARDAAIKIIRPETLLRAGEKQAALLRRRFEKEARSTAALRSPHTVELYDFGIAEGGGFYYVMELLDGVDLETLVREFGPIPPGRVIHILRQVCESLAEAHALGMVHRDVKPANIFLCQMGLEYDFSKVLDFGLVRTALSSETDCGSSDGVTTGTPAYMAPEVILGSPEIDGRVDVYGLGCVAYWLLTGGLVFDRQGAMATMMAHANDEPVPVSERTEAAIPASLEWLIMACLAKRPDERPANCRELARLLEECARVAPWAQKEAERWWTAYKPGKVKMQIEALAHESSTVEVVPGRLVGSL